jgi:hypothetical protein
MDPISEAKAKRRAILVRLPKAVKPAKARPQQIDSERLSKAIRFLKVHPKHWGQ